MELVGKFGEGSRTDLRYFEIEPGGYSSLEKHLHAHIVIGARGHGVLVLGSRRESLSPMDVACIGALEPHQLRNESSEPFGFFCIVDHDRDRPAALRHPDPPAAALSAATPPAAGWPAASPKRHGARGQRRRSLVAPVR